MTISPFARVPRASQTCCWTESLMNLTLPSDNKTLAPPGWMLWQFANSANPRSYLRVAEHVFHGASLLLGVTTVFIKAVPTPPMPQRRPSVTEAAA